MIKELNQVLTGLFQDINQQYIREATRIWDLGQAECPVFEIWTQMYVNKKWFDMVQSN